MCSGCPGIIAASTLLALTREAPPWADPVCGRSRECHLVRDDKHLRLQSDERNFSVARHESIRTCVPNTHLLTASRRYNAQADFGANRAQIRDRDEVDSLALK